MSAIKALTGFVVAVDWGDLPAVVRTRTAELLLDQIGVAQAGSRSPSAEIFATFAGPRNGGGPCRIIGLPGRYRPEIAALVNAANGHALELDDVTRVSSLHPGTVIVPTALAMAEATGATPSALGAAIVAGYEVMMRVGHALDAPSLYRRGLHPTPVAGVFGATMTSGKLMGLSAGELASSIGIAGTMASGSMEYLSDGSWTKRLNPGIAAHDGIVAAELARAGLRGPASGLDGRFGTLNALSDRPRPERLTEGLGGELQILRVAIKPYACCRYNHGLIDAMLDLRAHHGITVDEVRRIRLGVLSTAMPIVAEPLEHKRRPRNTVEAQFSAPYAAAIALVHGSAAADQFADPAADADVRKAMDRTECYTSPDLDRDYPERWPAEVQLDLVDGRTLRCHVEFASGEPENPVSRAVLRAKFVELGGDAAHADRILAFDTLPAASDLFG